MAFRHFRFLSFFYNFRLALCYVTDFLFTVNALPYMESYYIIDYFFSLVKPKSCPPSILSKLYYKESFFFFREKPTKKSKKILLL